jgi:hypothetical protein
VSATALHRGAHGRICRNPERYPDRSARWRHIGEGADCVFEVTTLLRALLASPLVQLQVIATAVAPYIHGLSNSLQKLWIQSDLHPGRSARRAHLAPMRRPDIDGAVRTLCRGMVLPEGMRMIL